MNFYIVRWRFTMDARHGAGILFGEEDSRIYRHCFYEDGTLENVNSEAVYDGTINYLLRYTPDEMPRAYHRLVKPYESFRQKMTCRFSTGQNGALYANLSDEKEKYRVQIAKSEGRYSFGHDVKCSCGFTGNTCIHIMAAAAALEEKLATLQHAYVVTDQPVDKSIFLEPQLTNATHALDNSTLDQETVEKIRGIIRMLDAAGSDVYYLRYHDYILNMEHGYDYDARFLEKDYAELLMALFDDPGYRKAVLDPGGFADPEDYEGRQRRSNRTCLKRVLKEYQKVLRELDEKGKYDENPYKEFLLKYRGDMSGLLRYFAEGKAELEDADLPFLESIAEKTECGADSIGAVAEKLDRMSDPEKAGPVLRRLLEKVSQQERVEIYSRLRNLSMSAAEIRKLDRADQMKMIRNTPVSVESFCYIMDDLLADSDAAVRGRHILFTLRKLHFTRDDALKKAIIDRTLQLPDNRLLLAYAVSHLNINGAFTARQGDPEKELTTYFDCGYEIGRERDSLYASFTVSDPESDAILLSAAEKEGKLQPIPSAYKQAVYPPELIRRVCLAEKEEKYNEAFAESREALEAEHFEKNHRKFAMEYRALCDSLTDGKILLSDSGKAGIEWLLYRDGDRNALAFRVGRSRKYIVKDAMEFISAFRGGRTVEYGRDLILTHDPDNLEASDSAMIKRLMTAKLLKGRKGEPNNKRFITISDALMGSLIEELAGRTVFLNEVPCRIRLESGSVRLKVSGKYVLSTNLNSRQEFFNLAGKGYLLTRSGGEDADLLDRVEGTAEEINLISLIRENPSVSIRPILKDFRKNIYSRFFEMFDVDPSVRRDFALSQIRLNTYFDFEKGAIHARTEMLRDGKKLRPEDVTDRIDRARVELLENYLQSIGFEEGVMAEESRVLTFFKMDFTRMKTLTNVYLSDSLKNKELKSVGKPVVRVTYQNNLVRVFLEKSEFTESELEKIIAGLRKKKKYILLDGERIVDLDSEAARDFGETVNDFGMNPADLYRKKTISMINAIKAFSHERSCRVDRYLRDMIEEIRSFKEADITPPTLKSPLRDYQTEGFKWLSILTKYNMGGILADDMGLGKTIQMIALLKADRCRKPSLVVCPKSLVFNWISEFARFDGSTRVTAVYGPDSRRAETIAAINYKEKAVFITSYDSLRNDISRYAGEFNYVILDEAQYIKNVNALKTKSVKELKASHRFAMTGTPIENSVVDLWSIFDFIMPGYFEELSRFRESDNQIIARKAAPFILRRVKEDVLEDLPAKYERILSAEMSEGQRRLYDAMRMEARKALDAGGKAFDLLPYLTRLRQVCVDPGMFVENYRDGSGKMDMLSELIPEYLEAHHRILIFSQFVRALESVRDMLEKKGIPVYFLSGATSAKERVEMMDSFNNGSGTDVFLISLKAGGTGLNLIGADTVIHLDPWWNVAAENQASDRTHRIGQTRNVEVIKLIASESIEQRVVELQDLKKEVIRQVISDDDGSVTSASLEDIAFVLES